MEIAEKKGKEHVPAGWNWLTKVLKEYLEEELKHRIWENTGHRAENIKVRFANDLDQEVPPPHVQQ